MNKSILKIEIDNSDDDWFFITATPDTFKGAGGIHNLNDILEPVFTTSR